MTLFYFCLIINLGDILKKLNINKKLNIKKRYIIYITLLILFITFFTLMIIAINNKNYNKVYNGITLNNIDISNYTKDELIKCLQDLNKSISKNISILENDKSIMYISKESINFEIDIVKTVNNVFAFGRSGNIFIDNFNILLNSNKIFDIEYKYDEKKLGEVINSVNLTLDNRLENDTYSIDNQNNKLILIPGKSGYVVNNEIFKTDILNIFKINNNENKYKLILKQESPKKLDKDKIISEVTKKPIDATIDLNTKPIKIMKEQYGIDVDKDKLKEDIDNLTKKTEIDLIILKPNITLNDLNYEEVYENISSFTTSYNTSVIGRSKNIDIATSKLDNVIINAGEVFSLNKILGEVSRETGYQEAIIYQGGKAVTGIGGGVCQVATTLYNTALYADLEILERHQHGLPVSYVKPSLDAAFYSNVQDLKFKNNKSYPIKLLAKTSDIGNLTIEVYGVKNNKNVEIKLESEIINTIPYKTQYIEDNNINKDIIITPGVNGYTSKSYFVKFENGKEIERKLLNTDTYSPQTEVIKRRNKEN